MNIRSNKARADRLASEVDAERRARREHLARARNIFNRRLGSPAGLAVCFGAGAVTGLHLGRAPEPRSAQRAENGYGDGDGDGDGEQEGFLKRMTDSPLGNIAIRLAAASLVRYVLISDQGDGGDAADAAGSGDSAGVA
jgi:hypothetical protein